MMVRKSSSLAALAVMLIALGCGNDGEGEPNGTPGDVDGDGYTVEDGDCNDENRQIYPGAPDRCDGVDNNCDGAIDEAFDADGDFWTTCNGDCRDNDDKSYPGAPEIVDGLDNDCDGIRDNNTDQYDDDGDGYSEDQGDCNDDPDQGGALISPGAIEVVLDPDGNPEGIDNNCNGEIDEETPPCPALSDTTDPLWFASALDVCRGVVSARFGEGATNARSRLPLSKYGNTYVPKNGPTFAVLSTGLVGDASSPSFVELSPGTNLGIQAPHPDPQSGATCGSADEPTINDLSAMEISLVVPANANAFSFDFNFMSVEFPEFVCSDYDDTFLALLESEAFTGNVSFDAMGNRVSINVGFFEVCDTTLDPVCGGDADLIGTGYEGAEGGGTGWLTTTAPVVPGEKITIKFAIFDEGDNALDSAVLIDNFRWVIEEVDGPVTVPMVRGRQSRRGGGTEQVSPVIP